jgi:hypothetical protein
MICARVSSQEIQTEDGHYEKIVRDFIRFDIGQLADPMGQIRYRFNSLRSEEAVPALVRGLNASTRMRASCPITALTGKLRGMLMTSKNPEVGTYILQHLDRDNAGPYAGYVKTLHEIAEAQVVRTSGNGLAEQHFRRRNEQESRRLVHTPGRKLTDLESRENGASRGSDDTRENGRRESRHSAARSAPVPPPAAAPDLFKLSIEELTDRLADRSLQSPALNELLRRADAGQDSEVAEAAGAVVRCLSGGDDSTREAAARLLGLLRVQSAIEPLIDTLQDSNANVRSAAATALTRITRQLFGPNDDATPQERQVAVARWRDWLSRQKKNTERAAR